MTRSDAPTRSSTIQFDFQTPQRFEASYVGADNARHRPIMIHRALFGSVERFMAILIEHYAGNMPTWLSPEQVRVLGCATTTTTTPTRSPCALRLDGVRVGTEVANEPLGARIRRAKMEKIPYILVVGDDDVANGTLGVNSRGSNDPERGVTLAQFRSRVRDRDREPRFARGALVPLERFSASWREAYVDEPSASENSHDRARASSATFAEQRSSESTGVLYRDELSYVMLNAFPYGSGHLLVLPRRHVANLQELGDDEYAQFFWTAASYGGRGARGGLPARRDERRDEPGPRRGGRDP